MRERSVKTAKQAIESRVAIVPETGCWLWLGCWNKCGYGVLNRGGSSALAHRVAYQAFVGEIADGLHVCHKCDVPACCNPSHLFVGTQKQNMEDCAKKGRIVGKRAQGENNHNAVFTNQQVRDIRASPVGHAELGRLYGVTDMCIYRMRRRETYKSVE